jgi:toxin HigB-1
MIKSFARDETAAFFRDGRCPPHWAAFASVARRKLDMVDYASKLEDLKSPPGNRLEKLRGDRAGQWSIRINDQWRICFAWTEAGPASVEIVDYH